MNSYLKFIVGVAILSATNAFAEMPVPVQLRLKSPGGVYPTEAGISVKLLVLSPASGCILREENFSAETITNGNLSLALGTGALGVSDPGLTLNQVYDNSKTKTGLSCVDANNNIVLVGQNYTPAAGDQRIIRVATTVLADPIIVNFNMRATPYAIQAESVGGKFASDLVSNDAGSQLNQANLIDLLQDVTRFNNLKSIAVSGAAATAVNFSGNLAGDVSGTQGAVSVDKIKGVPVSATTPNAGEILQYNGTQYVPVAPPSGAVTSVAGRTGAVTLSNTDISGLGDAAVLNVGTAAGTVAAGNDARFSDVVNASSTNGAGTIVKRDGSGNFAAGSISATNASVQNLYVYDSGNSNSVRIKAPAAFANYVLTLPVDDGAAGQILQTDGSGILSWANAGGGGSVNSVTATAPLVSSGGVNPDISLAQANATTSGYLTSGDWSSFNSKQNALGFTPLNAANNLSDLASPATARSNLSLGGAALLNVGTVAGTVAAGDDSRITGALQSSAFNTYVASASCTTAETMYWNSVSSTFACQAIAFPADAVTSVAGRTGAVVLGNTDISGLGGAAVLNVGTAAGTVAAGDDSRFTDARAPTGAASGDLSGTYPNPILVNVVTAGTSSKVTYDTKGRIISSASLNSSDITTALAFTPLNPANDLSDVVSASAARGNLGLGGAAVLSVGTAAGTVAAGDDSRMVNAVQTSTAHSGDVSGTASSLVVNKIKGVSVSAAAPNSGDVLQYDGSQYVPVAIPSAAVSSVAGRTGAVVLSSSDISGLGGAAVLNVGTAAGTVAAGDDSRMVNAVQTSTAHSGDVSGTVSSLVVNKIKGVLVSAAAPNSGDVLQYDGAQYVPVAVPSAPVASVAGRTGAVVLSNTDISGLGGAALLNVGTVAGTVAAGDDSRITGALQSSAFNTYVASASCTTAETMYWNSVSSTFACQAIAFPADAVSSVAGRTGAVVLSSSDISGLGTAAGLNVGVLAGEVVQLDGTSRIPASTLPTIALTTSSVMSGDVSGTSSTLSVDRIKGQPVSVTAPVAGQALVFNGSEWVPTTGFPSFSRKAADEIITDAVLVNVASLSFPVTAGVTYKYKFTVMYTAANIGTGFRLGLTYPAVTAASGLAQVASAGDGTDLFYQGVINFSGDTVDSVATPQADPEVVFGSVEGVIVPSANGTVQLIGASENNNDIIIKGGSFVEYVVIP